MEIEDLKNFKKGTQYIIPQEMVFMLFAEIEEANTDVHWWKSRYDAQKKIVKEYQKIMRKCCKKLTNDLVRLGRVTNSNAIYVRNELSHEYKIVTKKK